MAKLSLATYPLPGRASGGAQCALPPLGHEFHGVQEHQYRSQLWLATAQGVVAEVRYSGTLPGLTDQHPGPEKGRIWSRLSRRSRAIGRFAALKRPCLIEPQRRYQNVESGPTAPSELSHVTDPRAGHLRDARQLAIALVKRDLSAPTSMRAYEPS